jgi:hypothetical protein
VTGGGGTLLPPPPQAESNTVSPIPIPIQTDAFHAKAFMLPSALPKSQASDDPFCPPEAPSSESAKLPPFTSTALVVSTLIFPIQTCASSFARLLNLSVSLREGRATHSN